MRKVTVNYLDTGLVESIVIVNDADILELHPDKRNAPTREFQRADSIMQALLLKPDEGTGG